LPGEGADALIIEAFGSREAAEEFVRTGRLPLPSRERLREEMLRTLHYEEPIGEEILDLVQECADYIE